MTEILQPAHPDIVRLLDKTRGKMPTHVNLIDSEFYGFPIILKDVQGTSVYAIGESVDMQWVMHQQETVNV
jgi:hypothetical protein